MRFTFSLLGIFVLIFTACRRTETPTTEIYVTRVSEITVEPESKAWDNLSMHTSKLLPQDIVDPRLMEPSTNEVMIKAMTDGENIAFRLEWLDPAKNDTPGPNHMIDGCALQIPAKPDANLPAPQMGEKGRPVEISFLRADWQAIVEGRPDAITAIYPNATVHVYPPEAKPLEDNPEAMAKAANRYAPAKALGNRRAGPRSQPVEDLIAEGPGTLSPAPVQLSSGKGIRTKNGWAVVIVRPIPAEFSGLLPTHAAFAIWEGSHSEVGARKMRTAWIPVLLR
jgi:DMSO reductase family type II enzyme heme b subunit